MKKPEAAVKKEEEDGLKPPQNLGATKLERENYTLFADILALRIPPHVCSSYLKGLCDDIFRYPKVSSLLSEHQWKCEMEARKKHPLGFLSPQTLADIKNDPEYLEKNKGSSRLLLLKLAYKDADVMNELSRKGKLFLESVDKSEYEVVSIQIAFDYFFWTSQQLFQAILPPSIQEVPSSFEMVGHIAHLNLKPEINEYRFIIGQILIDKNPTIQTVVNKTDIIKNVFRVFPMEVVAGLENHFVTQVKENGCVFRFDYSKVYWNSRLTTEHHRLVSCIPARDIICDMFAGVGPFAIPAAKRGNFVYANDLNPASYDSLLDNIQLNHVESRVKAFNMDARDFVPECLRQIYQTHRNAFLSPSSPKIHFIMNLPQSALEFLDCFSCLSQKIPSLQESDLCTNLNLPLPWIHCYCFLSKTMDKTKLAAWLQKQYLPGSSVLPSFQFHLVRNVSPNKDMYCLSFQLPPASINSSVSVKRPLSPSALVLPESSLPLKKIHIDSV